MVRNIRGEMTVPVEMKVDVEFSHPDGATRALLEEAAVQIRALASVGEMSVGEKPGELPFASKAVKGDLVVQVPLPGELREAEIGRLEKELGKLEKGVQGTRGKLANEKFVANAPAAVVAQEREKLGKYEADMEAIRARLEELRG